jgi:hypothetical protein
MKFGKKDIIDILNIGQKVINIVSKENRHPSKTDEKSETNASPVISEKMTPEEEDALIEQTKAKLSGQSLSSPTEVLSTLKAFSEAATDAVKFCEVQKTKREEIRANRDIRIRQLETQRDIIMRYLERSFDERKYLFEEQFKVVDHALQTGNTQELAISLQCINDLAKSSPFKALTDIGNVQRTLEQEGSTFDI